jgi:hypothetical protein
MYVQFCLVRSTHNLLFHQIDNLWTAYWKTPANPVVKAMIERNIALRAAGLKHDGNVHSNVTPEQAAQIERNTYGSPIRVGESGPAYRARLEGDRAA